MVDLVHLPSELRRVTFLEGRTRDTPLEAEADAFARIGSYRGGEMYVGGFSGCSGWERHPSGDELVHVLQGSATLTLLTDDGTRSLGLEAGTILVVPQGLWHRFDAPDGVTVMTITPPPTEHSTAEGLPP